MSTKFQQVAAVSFTTPDSKYVLGKLRLKHWAEYAQYVGFIKYRKAKDHDAPKEILDELFREGLATDYDFNSPEVLGTLTNPICVAHLLEVSLRIGNPGISEKEIQDYLTDENNQTKELINSFFERQGLIFEEIDEKNE